MKISELVAFLLKKQMELGDVTLWGEEDDGRSTWARHVTPSITYRKIWKGHSDAAHWYLKT